MYFFRSFIRYGLISFVALSTSVSFAQAQVKPKVEQNKTQAVKKVEAVKPKGPSTYELLDRFGEVLEKVKAHYVDKVSDQKLIEAAIQGMVSSLDPHSSYFNKKDYQKFSVAAFGKFGGLGIKVMADKSGNILVISPIDDTPAQKAGIKAGDLIIKIDGKPVQGQTLDQSVEKMRGKIGAPIELTIYRKGDAKPLVFKLKRAEIKVRSVRSLVQNGIGYIRITSFNSQAGSELNQAIKEIQKKAGKKIVGYILDLRNNPGGQLNQATAVVDTFLNEGEIVSTRGRDHKEGQRYYAHGGDLTKGLPIVVLINEGSASASEIVAGALQDHKRAVIMGTRSFGKGSVQTVMRIGNDGAAMKITTARYYTPSGRSIQGKGITPDIKVEEATIEPIRSSYGYRESDLQGALKNEDDVKKAQDKTNFKTNTEKVNSIEGQMSKDKTGAVDKTDSVNKTGTGAKDGSQKQSQLKTVKDAKTKDGKDEKPVKLNLEDYMKKDYQLRRAADFLHGIAAYRPQVQKK